MCLITEVTYRRDVTEETKSGISSGNICFYSLWWLTISCCPVCQKRQYRDKKEFLEAFWVRKYTKHSTVMSADTKFFFTVRLNAPSFLICGSVGYAAQTSISHAQSSWYSNLWHLPWFVGRKNRLCVKSIIWIGDTWTLHQERRQVKRKRRYMTRA